MKTSHLLCFLFLAIVLFSSCENKIEPSRDIEFQREVSAYTSGIISRADPIVLRLTQESASALPEGTKSKNNIFSISPKTEGSVVWKDKQTIIFEPDNWLDPAQEYTVTVNLAALMEVPEDREKFIFKVLTHDIHGQLDVSGFNYYSPEQIDLVQIKGQLKTSDIVNNDEIERAFSAKLNGSNYSVKWTHKEALNSHNFIIDSLPRTGETGTVQVLFEGKKIGAIDAVQRDITIPSLGDFKVVDTQVIQDPEQEIIIQFSDPLNPKQDLTGLIQLAGQENLRTLISSNEIRIYPSSKVVGNQDITISAGIQNILEYKLAEALVVPLLFESVKPGVQWIGESKTILPSSDGLVMPFKAASLSAVDVKVVKIFEDNVHQFLQVNALQGQRELKRVGRVVRKKTVELGQRGDVDLSRWHTYFLDLSELIETEPGAIYQVSISFRYPQSVYECSDLDIEELAENYEPWDSHGEEEASAWDQPSNYYYYDDYYDDYYDYDYNYSERDNPCDATYYRYAPTISRNVLASDIGVIAKAGSNGKWHLATTDLITAKPNAGVELEIYNYQEVLLGKTSSNSQGLAEINGIDTQPFLLVASKNGQKGYVKLNRGENLSMSQFDVGGQQLKEGLNGMIYGERGVWRPGDTLFLSFILQDELSKLPAEHPLRFELYDVRGRLVHKEISSVNDQSLHCFTIPTSQDAPTGNYRASVRIGSAVFQKTIKVETIKPNRLKIDVDFNTEQIDASDNMLDGDINLQWLHGAIAKNLRVNVNMTLRNKHTSFEGFEDYGFTDLSRSFYAEEKTIFDAKVNAQGTADINYMVDLNTPPPGLLTAYFDIKAFEQGGDFSIDGFSLPYSPYEHYVGIKVPKPENYYALETDKDHEVQIVTVDQKGKTAANKELRYEMFKVSWRWWWQRSNEDFSRYIGREGIVPLTSGTVTTNSKGEAKFDFNVASGDYGRYLVRVIDEDGHSSGTTIYLDWPKWKRNRNQNPEGASMLVLTAEEDEYEVGETCQFTFPSAPGAQALITVETGSEVLVQEWMATTEETSQFSFKLEPGMAPNVYAHVMLIQPHHQTENDAPIRMYGVIPIEVQDKNTILEPIVKTPESVRPESNYSIEVSEKNGKEMYYTLAVVDEGLLALTRFKTPKPHPHFYAKEALGVRTWDMFDNVIGAYGIPIDKLLSIGGDGEVENTSKNRANRFKPVVRFIGPFKLNKGKKTTHQLKMDNYIGDVRVMLVACTKTAYGHADANIKVKKPLMVLATLPRVVGPEEEVMLPVNVFAMEDKIKNVDIKVITNEFFTLENTTAKMTFAEKGDQVITFPLKVASKTGIGTVKVEVSSGNEKSYFDIELDVRNPNPYMQHFEEKVVQGGQSWSTEFDLIGIEGTNDIAFEASYLPSLNLERRLNSLLRYPHGCVEQTTSKAFPQLFLNQVVELTDQQKAVMESNISNAIKRLAMFQTSDGGLGYWPGASAANEWGTSYAGHFLLEAEKAGYEFPSAMKKNWVKYQKNQSRSWRPNTNDTRRYTDLMQAYRLYTLALAGESDLSAMNRLRETSNLSIQSKWRLAAAYALIGQKKAAKDLVEKIGHHFDPYRSLGYHYGSARRDQAMVLETLILIDQFEDAADVAIGLAEHMRSRYWMSTQEMAWSIIALAKFAGESSDGRLEFTLNHNGEVQNYTSELPVVAKTMKIEGLAKQNFQIKNTGEKVIYINIVNTGQPAAGNEVAERNNLEMYIEYLDGSGYTIDHTKIEQGTDFTAKVVIYNPSSRRRYDEMALTQVFPSGWEIINDRMTSTTSSQFVNDYSDYRDYRDDRVNTYFSCNYDHENEYYVRLNASYLGKYYLPAVTCEAMYDNSIFAHSAGTWVEVVPPGTP